MVASQNTGDSSAVTGRSDGRARTPRSQVLNPHGRMMGLLVKLWGRLIGRPLDLERPQNSPFRRPPIEALTQPQVERSFRQRLDGSESKVAWNAVASVEDAHARVATQ